MKGRLFSALILFFLLHSVSVPASDPFLEASRKTGLDPGLLLEIARKESSLRPLALHVSLPVDSSVLDEVKEVLSLVQGRVEEYTAGGRLHLGIYPASVEEAVLLVRFFEKLRELVDVDFDVGLMQINIRNIKRWNLGPAENFLDPQVNVLAGAYVFMDCLVRYETLEAAMECYRCGRSPCSSTNLLHN